MKEARSLALHASLLVLAAASAGFSYLRDRSEQPAAPTEVALWSGRGADVERVTWESKTRKVVLTGKKDAQGTWFEGRVERDAPATDGGAAARTTSVFTSVGAATKLADTLAQLRAARSLGRLEGARAAEFGLAEPEGTLTVKVGAAEHQLRVGATSPGATDRYVLDPARGEGFAIKADVLRDLEAAEARLTERDLHAWKEADVASVRVVAGSKTRAYVRGGDAGKHFWATAAAKDKPDETVTNWMQKLDRVRVNEFVEKLPQTHTTALRVEYAGASGPLGFRELVRASGENGKDEWYLTTEHARLWGKVTPALAEAAVLDTETLPE